MPVWGLVFMILLHKPVSLTGSKSKNVIESHLRLVIASEEDNHIAYTWNLKKKNTNELIYKTEIDPQTQKTNLWLPKGKGVGEG